MKKQRKSLDACQSALDFDQPIEAYTLLRDQLVKAAPAPIEAKEFRYEEYCIEIAVSIKKAIRASGLSREQIVDEVNDFYGWPKNDGRKSLTIHMLNNHLCKPTEYPVPMFLIHAVHRITGSLEPLATMAEMEGARIITGDEVRKLALGKIDDAIQEMQKLKRSFRTHPAAA
jgi:hypothetical protein